MKKVLVVGAMLVAAIGTAVAVLADDAADGKIVTASEAKETVTSSDQGTVVTIEGKLQNAGTNYFTDRRIVLKDSSGEIDVQAWLPMTTEPASDSSGKPEALSDYLGKQVVLTGMVTKQPVKGIGLKEVLVVDDANLASK
jgi:hypothetical protein